ncbi:hypothetical protein LC574_31370 [Nostoc sp. CHAB 5715]|nr:hypothetical protein [Nostoc sp. CHAB 5715]
MKLRSHIGADGILQIQTPTDLKDTNVEVVVVIQQYSSVKHFFLLSASLASWRFVKKIDFVT